MSTTMENPITMRMDLDESTYLVEDFKTPKVNETLDEQAEAERERIDEQILDGLLTF